VQTSHPYMGLGFDSESRAAAYNLLKVYEAIRKRLDGQQAGVSTPSRIDGNQEKGRSFSALLDDEEACMLGSKVRHALAAFRSRRSVVRPIPSPPRHRSVAAVSPLVPTVADAVDNDEVLFDPPSPLRHSYAVVANDIDGHGTALSDSLFSLSEDLGWGDEGSKNLDCNDVLMERVGQLARDNQESHSLLLRSGRPKATQVAGVAAATPAKKTTESTEAKEKGSRQDTPVCVAFFDDNLSGDLGNSSSHVAAGRSSTSEMIMGFDHSDEQAVGQQEEAPFDDDDNDGEDNDDDDLDFIPPKPARQSYTSKFISRASPAPEKQSRAFHGSSFEDAFEIEVEANPSKVIELRDHQQQSSEDALAEALSFFISDGS